MQHHATNFQKILGRTGPSPSTPTYPVITLKITPGQATRPRYRATPTTSFPRKNVTPYHDTGRESMPRPTSRRGNSCGCPSPFLNGKTGNRRSIHALPQFDKQEHMSHTIHKRLLAAHSHDNEEVARYGKDTARENHALASQTCPVSSAPGEVVNFTITREMQQNATPCNKFSKNPWQDGPFSQHPTHPVITLKIPSTNLP